MMLKLLLKRGKGSISVFVTVIMVPVVFFIGFLVDLSRIKFCGNQAVMAADNYGEAILTDYDNLLKELYGLFALTQNKEGEEALDRLDEYVKTYYMTSFKPNENRIDFAYFQDFTGTDPYEGWMPYQNAEVTFEAVPAAGATLSEPEVFNTQIGDFMKFRIIQTVGDDMDGIVQAIESVQNMESNIEAVEKRDEITEKAAKVLEAAQDYYVQLEALWQYPDYIAAINDTYAGQKTAVENTLESKYSYYKAYADEDPEAIKDAMEHRKEIEEAEEEASETEAQPETEGSPGEGGQPESGGGTGGSDQEADELSEEEERLCKIDDEYSEHLEHKPDELQKVFDKAAENLTKQIELEDKLGTIYSNGGAMVTDHDGNRGVTVNFSNFDQKAAALVGAADVLEDRLEELQALRSQLDTVLQDDKITPELKKGIETEMEELDQLFGGEGDIYTAENYRELAQRIADYSDVNSTYRSRAEAMLNSIKERKEECIDFHPELSELPDDAELLNLDLLKNYRIGYAGLHDALQNCFGNDTSGSKEAADQKQDDAEKLLGDVGTALEDEETDAGERDIPSGGDFAGMGDSGTAGRFDITSMIGSAADHFGSNTFADVGNRLLTKVYLVQYDFGMFTSRVTNVEDTGDSDGEADAGETVQTSLTGYPMAPNINYLYQSEIEYLLGGHNSSKENLNEARNKILAFRAVMNFASTYTISEVNDVIQWISSEFAAVPVVGPALKIIVAGALRLAVAGVETYGDWVLLKKGESVCVLKKAIGDLSLPGEFAGGLSNLLGVDISTGGEKGDGFQMNYEQYCMVMMIFLTRSEVLSQRLADLITLNVNTVKQKTGPDGTLSELTFKMEDTVTAVDVTCAVQLDMAVMPKGFARSTVDADTYAAIEEFEGNVYRYTVTRGY